MSLDSTGEITQSAQHCFTSYIFLPLLGYLWSVSDLIPCVNLKYLHISDTTSAVKAKDTSSFTAALPEKSNQLYEFEIGLRTSAAIMELCTARRPDGQPIIHFGSLSELTVNIVEPGNCKTSQELFRHCHALTFLVSDIFTAI